MATETNESRLDRIEQKIDKLADAMISLARAEEKIIALQEDHDNMRERMNKLSVKLDDISPVNSSDIVPSNPDISPVNLLDIVPITSDISPFNLSDIVPVNLSDIVPSN